MKRLPKIGLLFVAAASGWFVAAHLPGLRDVRGWFYAPRHAGLGEAWAVALAVTLVPALCVAGVRLVQRGRQVSAGALLLAAAVGAQLLFVQVDHGGLDTVWRRHVEGHGEFLRVARSRRGELLPTLRRYETLVTAGELGVFAPSKPPGALGVYMVLDELAQWEPLARVLAPYAREAREHPRIEPTVANTAALSLFVMPMATALTVVPLVWLGFQVFRRHSAAYAAAVLQLSAPAVLLIDHHLDGALYPLVAVTSCALAATGIRRRRHGWSFAAGVALGLGLYVSFSLIPVIGLALGCISLIALDRGLAPRASALRQGGAHGVVLLGGLVLTTAALQWALDYQPALRLPRALEYHARWKASIPTGPWRGWALAEFTLYVGAPLMAALLALAAAGLGRLRRSEMDSPTLASLGVVAFLLALSLVAGTNEVARLWLFAVPFVALAVAAGLPRYGSARDWTRPLAWLAGAQAVLALILEANLPW